MNLNLNRDIAGQTGKTGGLRGSTCWF